MTVNEIIAKIHAAQSKIDRETDDAAPDYDLIDILEDYIILLGSMKVVK